MLHFLCDTIAKSQSRRHAAIPNLAIVNRDWKSFNLAPVRDFRRPQCIMFLSILAEAMPGKPIPVAIAPRQWKRWPATASHRRRAGNLAS